MMTSHDPNANVRFILPLMQLVHLILFHTTMDNFHDDSGIDNLNDNAKLREVK